MTRIDAASILLDLAGRFARTAKPLPVCPRRSLLLHGAQVIQGWAGDVGAGRTAHRDELVRVARFQAYRLGVR